MIDCASYRRAMLADPHDADPELREHVAGCADCARFTAGLTRFEQKFARALRIDAPPARPVALPTGSAPNSPSDAPRAGGQGYRALHKRFPGVNRTWLAMAATVLIVLSAVTGLWLAAPGRSLAADVVAHMAEEPQAWARSDVPVPAAALDQVLRAAHVRLRPGAGLVSYANSCEFRGHKVPHLVVQTDVGSVTVMVLPHESVDRTVPFDEEGYRGVIVPVPGHGSLAVLARGQSADMDAVRRVAASVLDSVEWTG